MAMHVRKEDEQERQTGEREKELRKKTHTQLLIKYGGQHQVQSPKNINCIGEHFVFP